jgi:hypothetical protein
VELGCLHQNESSYSRPGTHQAFLHHLVQRVSQRQGLAVASLCEGGVKHRWV